MSLIHILRDRQEPRPWWRMDERTGLEAGERVFTDCCSCWMDASECETRIHAQEIPLGFGKDDYQLGQDFSQFDLSYFDPRWEVRCGKGFGCSANPKRRSGAMLRHMSHWGP